MVNDIKTLEQIQEEFLKKIEEIRTEEKNEEAKADDISNKEISEEFFEEDSLEDIPFEEVESVLGDELEDYSIEGFDPFWKTKLRDRRIKTAKVIKFITGIVMSLCIVGFILGGVMYFIGSDHERTVFGYSFFPVVNGEMDPTYNRGDMVVYEVMDIEDMVDSAKEGKVIVTYTANERKDICIGRIVCIERDDKTGDVYYCIQGDNHGAANRKVHARLVLGVAKKLPLKWFAYGTDFVVEHARVFLLSFSIPLLICFILRAIFVRNVIEEDYLYDEDYEDDEDDEYDEDDDQNSDEEINEE